MSTERGLGDKAFATIRFAGDELDPAEISRIIPIAPSRAHRKGETFTAGRYAGEIRGRTGVWFLTTDSFVRSDDLAVHLRFLQDLLYPSSHDQGRVAKLKDVLARSHSQAHITCFWQGDSGEPPPVIPADFRSAMAPLAVKIETDFNALQTT